ncbi:hypothetical protein L228DRAFT_251756 [Xylona heveae TC161]|uniref:Uncharacterized protein n=1 Tax=Xylona heveae (strain CBS 132557 / TC161) TaxID=1328760 RepID=A0A164ZB19_XYLHT|nr:hypothetical protein L228DRAFT_251756 [Xylona heveae TC161]KZF18886.1 hypothetical protein L228DRAFT_251756 [Xylona heveae TC161]
MDYPTPMAKVSGRRPQSDLDAEVDEMILDYLIWSASKAFLDCNKEGQNDEISSSHFPLAESAFSLVDAFLKIFKSKHPERQTLSPVRHRLALLRYCSIFFCGPDYSAFTVPSLISLRDRNLARAKAWQAHQSTVVDTQIFQEIDISAMTIFSSKAFRSGDNSIHEQFRESTQNPYKTANDILLLDTLPLFMEFSAAELLTTCEMDITTAWVGLAGEYMLQSVLEQYLIQGLKGLESAKEAFAWGFGALKADEPSNSMVGQANTPFDEDLHSSTPSSQHTMLADVRQKFLSELLPKNGKDMEFNLKYLLTKYPRRPFFQRIASLLETLLTVQSPPALSKFELGLLDGLSASEMEAVRNRVGCR